jgi:hypothetical protein
MLSMVATDRMAAKLGIELVPYIAAGDGGPSSRCATALLPRPWRTKCDWLMCIDDDIGFNAPDFFKMFNHGVDVVAAAPAKRHHRWDEQPAASRNSPKAKSSADRGRPHLENGRVPTGFMAIRSTVIEKMESVTRPYVTEGTQVRDWFWLDLITEDGQTTDEGEDYNFCRKWLELGGECWVDPDIRVRHYTGSVCHDVCLADAEIREEEAA